jgi:hypothetical protein
MHSSLDEHLYEINYNCTYSVVESNDKICRYVKIIISIDIQFLDEDVKSAKRTLINNKD